MRAFGKKISKFYRLTMILLAKQIFISYTEKDKSRMETLKRIIEQTKFFNPPLIIGDLSYASRPLDQKVIDGINMSDYIIPILTTNSISSQWVNQEIGFATASRKTILPIVQEESVDFLKGFIHKNIDLPYRYRELNSGKAMRESYI